MTKTAGMCANGPLAEALGAFAADILTEGRAAVDGAGRSDALIVHDFRKAAKRWRAFLRLVEPSLGAEARALRRKARDLARQLAAARDGQSALDALADLAKEEQSLSPRSLGAVARRLEAVRNDAECAALNDVLRARMHEMLESAEKAIPAWPLADLRFSHVAAGLARNYRRARRALPGEWSKADADALHRLRQRVIIHRYQMEFVEPLWPRLGKLWVGEAQRLRERLGACQDLVVLTRLTAPHQALAPWRSRLTPLIARRHAVHIDAATRIAARLFAEKPRAFRRRLLALEKAGRRPFPPAREA